MASVEPDVVVLLGATAAKALLGNDFRVTQHRREILHSADVPGDPALVATIHPSALLRGPKEDRESGFADLVEDLRVAGSVSAADVKR
jgi:DNA polymerase